MNPNPNLVISAQSTLSSSPQTKPRSQLSNSSRFELPKPKYAHFLSLISFSQQKVVIFGEFFCSISWKYRFCCSNSSKHRAKVENFWEVESLFQCLWELIRKFRPFLSEISSNCFIFLLLPPFDRRKGKPKKKKFKNSKIPWGSLASLGVGYLELSPSFKSYLASSLSLLALLASTASTPPPAS